MKRLVVALLIVVALSNMGSGREGVNMPYRTPDEWAEYEWDSPMEYWMHRDDAPMTMADLLDIVEGKTES